MFHFRIKCSQHFSTLYSILPNPGISLIIKLTAQVIKIEAGDMTRICNKRSMSPPTGHQGKVSNLVSRNTMTGWIKYEQYAAPVTAVLNRPGSAPRYSRQNTRRPTDQSTAKPCMRGEKLMSKCSLSHQVYQGPPGISGATRYIRGTRTFLGP